MHQHDILNINAYLQAISITMPRHPKKIITFNSQMNSMRRPQDILLHHRCRFGRFGSRRLQTFLSDIRLFTLFDIFACIDIHRISLFRVLLLLRGLGVIGNRENGRVCVILQCSPVSLSLDDKRTFREMFGAYDTVFGRLPIAPLDLVQP